MKIFLVKINVKIKLHEISYSIQNVIEIFSNVFWDFLVFIFDECKTDTVKSSSNTDKSKIGRLKVFFVKNHILFQWKYLGKNKCINKITWGFCLFCLSSA